MSAKATNVGPWTASWPKKSRCWIWSRDDFSVDNLTYAIRSGEARPEPDKGCEFGEAAVALACAQSASLATQAKREVSRLWDDTTKSPYKALFNAKTNHLRVWRSVQILRAVDQELDRLRSPPPSSDPGTARRCLRP
jgi:hypothetical protein